MKLPSPAIGLTIGDTAGIGPELLLKILNNPENHDKDMTVFGSKNALLECSRHIGLECEIDGNRMKMGQASFQLVLAPTDPPYDPGSPSNASAKAAWESLDAAIEAALKNEIQAIVTCPINKAQMLKIGFPFPGHTEYIAGKCHVLNPIMMYDAECMRVALATTHIPFADVISNLTSTRIVDAARSLEKYLINILDRTPVLAIAALNPHGGSGDFLGPEEMTIIEPAVQKLIKYGMKVSGPHPADTVFLRNFTGEFDGVVSLYHDQGSIAVKTSCFENAVNVTLGLPFIRTSVDHGTAYNIAGKLVASPKNLQKAVNLAIRIANNFF